MEYPFKFNEIILTDKMLKLLGFTNWSDGAGDFSHSRIHLGDKSFEIYSIDEKEDDADGYGFHPKQYCVYHYCDGNWNSIYFLHDLYEYIKSGECEPALVDFISRCEKCNLMPNIESYLRFLNGDNQKS